MHGARLLVPEGLAALAGRPLALSQASLQRLLSGLLGGDAGLAEEPLPGVPIEVLQRGGVEAGVPEALLAGSSTEVQRDVAPTAAQLLAGGADYLVRFAEVMVDAPRVEVTLGSLLMAWPSAGNALAVAALLHAPGLESSELREIQIPAAWPCAHAFLLHRAEVALLGAAALCVAVLADNILVVGEEVFQVLYGVEALLPDVATARTGQLLAGFALILSLPVLAFRLPLAAGACAVLEFLAHVADLLFVPPPVVYC